VSSASNFIGDSVNRPSRLPNESQWRGHVVISKWEASIFNTLYSCTQRTKSWFMPAKVLERQRVKIVSLVNSKLAFAHHLSLQEATSLGPTRGQHRNRRWLVKCRMVIHFLCTLSDDDAFYISGSLLTQTALLLFSLAWKSYLHKSKLYMIKKTAMRRTQSD